MKNILAFVVIIIFSVVARANASAVGAEEFIRSVSESTLRIVSSEKYLPEEKEAQLSKLFENSVDTKWIAKFVMGRYWGEINDSKKDDYSKLYHKFLLQSYMPNFKTYTNEVYKLLDTAQEFENEYLVRTEIENRTNNPIRIDYKVRKDSNGNYHIFDIIAEGISMITTQRSEFGSILSRKGVDFLIERLEVKTKDMG